MFWKDRNNELKKIFFVTLIFGFIVYIRMITLWLANPDSVWQGMIVKENFDWENSLGRFGLGYVARLKGYFVFPALGVVFNLMLVACIAVTLYKLFEIQNPFWGYMTGALLVVSPSLASTLTYHYTSDAYTLAYLCSVLFVYVLVRGKLAGFWAAVVLLAISLSMYQAYVGTAITLCLLYLLFLLLGKDLGIRQVLKQGGRFLVAGGGGVLLYLLAFKVFCRQTGVVPEPSRGFNHMGRIPIREMADFIGEAYKCFFDYFLTDAMYNNSWSIRREANLLFLILLIGLAAALYIRRRLYLDIGKTVLVLFFMGCMPVAFMSIVILAPQVSVRDVTGILMIPHMNFLFVFVFALASSMKGLDGSLSKFVKWPVLAAACIMVYVLTLYTQIFQNCMEMDLRTTYTLANRMLEQVEEMPEYEQGMPLIVGGRAEQGNYPRIYSEMYTIVQGTVAEYGYMWKDVYGQQGSWLGFLRDYMGAEYAASTMETLSAVMASEEYRQMSVFPTEGSVRMIEGRMVVKLSN